MPIGRYQLGVLRSHADSSRNRTGGDHMGIVEEYTRKMASLTGRDIVEPEPGVLVLPEVQDFRRILAIGDIHGEYERLCSLWAQVDYKPDEDLLIFLGDYIDRGADPLGCLQLILEIRRLSPYVITLSGNHELMLREYFQNHDIAEPLVGDDWTFNGGKTTFLQLQKLQEEEPDEFRRIRTFLYALPYVAFCGPYIFTHAGLDENRSFVEQREEMLWKRDAFQTYAGNPFLIVGHTPVQYFGSSYHEPLLFKNRVLYLDTGSYLPDGHISCIDIKANKVWQSREG